MLSLVCLLLADAINLQGTAGYVARLEIPGAAVLMSAGVELRTATLARLAACGCFTLVLTRRWLESVLLGNMDP